MDHDVIIIGAGAAGLAAGQRLRKAGLYAVVVEARARVGGRGHTLTPAPGLGLDLGCGWLHSADRNPFARIAEAEGFTIDKTPAAWGQEAPGFGMSQVERRAFGQALDAMEAAVETAARAPGDRAVSELLDPHGAWTPMLNAFSAYYNGAEFDQVSVKDYAAFADDEVNWRVVQGYGRTIAGLADGLEVVLEAPVSAVDHAGPRLRVHTAKGVLEAGAVIVTLPTDVIASGAVRFDPGLPQVLEAASQLPLGLADKVYLALDDPEAFPADAHIFGRRDRTETGSYYLRPFGRPLIECYLGGRHARALEADGPGASGAFAVDELCALLGSSARGSLHPIAASRWAAEPYSMGSYSHALPGHGDARGRLAEPIDGRLFFAGEATSPDSFSTAHGAYLEGIRAAEALIAAQGMRA